MRGLNRFLTYEELVALCATLINGSPLAQNATDIAQAINRHGYDVSRSWTARALEDLGNRGVIGFTVDHQNHWLFYSKDWTYGGGNL